MTNSLSNIVTLLVCPDDGQSLRYEHDKLQCDGCAREFPVLAENLIELLPNEPATVKANTAYYTAYLELFAEQFRRDRLDVAWGAEESASSSWLRSRRRQVRAVLPLVIAGTDPGKSILCDLAAGAGHYSFAYAEYFRFVLHCDLSPTNLSYCQAKAEKEHLSNIVFLRIDYFSPPFRNAIDRVICFDTIIRGDLHDGRLLQSIMHSVRMDGKAIVDFHNWWHNPARRLGIFSDNFVSNKSYSRKAATNLLNEIGIYRFAYHPFRQECDEDSILALAWRYLIPPTRLMFAFDGYQQRADTQSASSLSRQDGPSR